MHGVAQECSQCLVRRLRSQGPDPLCPFLVELTHIARFTREGARREALPVPRLFKFPPDPQFGPRARRPSAGDLLEGKRSSPEHPDSKRACKAPSLPRMDDRVAFVRGDLGNRPCGPRRLE